MRSLMPAVAFATLLGCSASGREPLVTPVGEPNGISVDATVGALGGLITSADGRLVLTIPEGALVTDQVFHITPITNQAPGGLGDGYRIEPSGTTFSVPATLTFAVGAQDVAHTSGEGLGVAYQDAQRIWRWLDASAFDPSTQTLSTTTNHLTDYTMVAGLQLMPFRSSVEVGQMIDLTVVYCFEPDPDSVDPFATMAGFPCVPDVPLPPLMPLTAVRDWSVNGTVGGNARLGTIAAASGDGLIGRYRAPAEAPSPRTVAASVHVVRPERGDVILVAEVRVGVPGYDAVIAISTTDVFGTASGEIRATLELAEETDTSTQYLLQGTVRLLTPTITSPEGTVCEIASGDETHTVDASHGIFVIVHEPAPAIRWLFHEIWNATCHLPGAGDVPGIISLTFATYDPSCTSLDLPIPDDTHPSGSHSYVCTNEAATATWSLVEN